MRYSVKTLTINGYHHELVPNTFIQQKGETQHLAIVLPGLRYTADGPLLYYPTNLLLAMEADVLRVEYTYWRADFQTLKHDEQAHWIFTDATASYQAAMAQRHYTRLTFIGKSLGTLSMGHVLRTETLPSQVETIWLTPLIRNDRLRGQIQQFEQRSLLVIGTADPHYDSAVLREIQESSNRKTMIIDRADHGLNIENNVIQSIEALKKVILTVERFLAG